MNSLLLHAMVTAPAPAVAGAQPTSTTPQQRRFCIEILPKVSRTFALSIEALPETLRDAVRVSYLLCRIVDTIEDEAHLERPVRNELFDLFDAALTDDAQPVARFERRCAEIGLGGDSPDHELVCNASAAFMVFRALPRARREAVRPHILEMSQGMREYAERAADEGKLRLRDMADLERYCYYVAGTVGHLLTALFEQVVPTLDAEDREFVRERAVSFGLGLQMVNIVKDVATDFPRDVCFLPRATAEKHGLSLDQILDPDKREPALAVIRDVCAKAREHLEKAQAYTLRWPNPDGLAVRLFCAVPLTLALATLHEVEHGEDTLRPGFVPKVSRELVGQVLQDAQRGITSNDRLAALFAEHGGSGRGV